MATRQDSMHIAEQLVPNGFKFNDLELHNGVWIATYVDDHVPPRVVVERWQDFFTDDDPAEPNDGQDDDNDEV